MRKNFVIVVLLLSLSACYESIEGCLDATATNFDPEADESCCCNYPQLRLELLYQYDSLEFIEGVAFDHPVHEQIAVLDMGFILRSFALKTGMSLDEVTDSTEFWIKNGQDSLRNFLRDDLILFGDRFNYTIGELLPTGSFDALVFESGLDSDYQQVLPASLTDHPLATLNSKGYWEEGLGFQEAFLRVAVGADLQDTLTWSNNFEDFTLNFEIEGPFQKTTGKDLLISLDFDVKCWLSDTDFYGNATEITKSLKNSLDINDCIKIRE